MVHEWSLAEAVIEAVKTEALNKGVDKVSKVVIGVGSLQNIEVEIFKEALETISRERGLDIQEILIETDEAKFRCRVCNYTWGLNELSLTDDEREAIHFIPELLHAFVECPSCKSTDYEVIEGRGVIIKEIEV